MATIRTDIGKLPSSSLVWLTEINLLDFIRPDDDDSEIPPCDFIV